MSETVVSAHDDTPVRALLLIAGSTVLFSVQDVIIRLLSGEYSLMEILAIRGVITLTLLYLFLKLRGEAWKLRPTKVGILTVRAVLVFLSFSLYYLAIVSIPMAAATSIYYVAPLMLTGMAAVIGKETVGVRRWSAVIVGLIGVVVIIRPGSEAIDPAAILALCGAVTYAGFNLLTRRLKHVENAWSLSFSHNVGYVIFAGICGLIFGDGAFFEGGHPAFAFVTRAWIMPGPDDAGLIALTGLIAAIGFYGLTEGYRSAPSSLAAPFEYIIIPCSVFWGFFIWGEVPLVTTWLGMALIFGGGIYVIYRERRVGEPIIARRFSRWRP